jgi:DNA-binding MarR family transcriptional regulator
MDPIIRKKFDEHFFQILQGQLDKPYEEIFRIFNVDEGLSEKELFSISNIKKLEYLFSTAALSFSSDKNRGLIHPVIAIPSVNTESISHFLIDRLKSYNEKDPNLRFSVIDCKNLVGSSPLFSENPESIKIPNLIKWRIENEDGASKSKLFLLTNITEILLDKSLLFNEVVNELNSISADASFIIFLTPSAYHIIKSSFTDEDFELRFSRIIYFEGFEIDDPNFFKEVVENRLKSNEKLNDISLGTDDLHLILRESKGVPFYSFKILENFLKNVLIQNTNDFSYSMTTLKTDQDFYTSLWDAVDSLTVRQIDILATLLNTPNKRANIKDIREKLRYIRGEGVGNRSAITQQITKLYEKNIIDKERPPSSKIVYYRVKTNVEPAIEYKICEKLLNV